MVSMEQTTDLEETKPTIEMDARRKLCLLCLNDSTTTTDHLQSALDHLDNRKTESCVKILISYILKNSSEDREERKELHRNILSCWRYGNASICMECLTKAENLMKLQLELEKVQMQILEVLRNLQGYLKSSIRGRPGEAENGEDGDGSHDALFRFQDVLREKFMCRTLSDGAQVHLERLSPAGNTTSSSQLPHPQEVPERDFVDAGSSCDMDMDTFENDDDGETYIENVKVNLSKAKPRDFSNAFYFRRRCDICYEEIPFRDLERHLQTHSQFEKLYKCEICPESGTKSMYGSYKGLVWHYLQSQHNIKLPCKLCPKQRQNILFRGRDLCKHLYHFHQIDHSKIKCTFENCSQEFCDPSSRNSHRVYAHFPKHRDKSLTCQLCKITFKTIQGLRQHNNLKGHGIRKPAENEVANAKIPNCSGDARESWKGPYVIGMCDICYIKVRRSKLVQHLRKHAQFEKEYKCDICPDMNNGIKKRCYGSYKGLIWHYMQAPHHVEMPCHLCQGQDQSILFKGKDLCKHLYDCHQLDHRKLQCKFENCSEEFCDPVSRNSHYRYKHSSKNGILTCGTCKKTFKMWHLFKLHMKRHRRDHEGFRFPCKSCEKVYKDARRLRKHRKCHEDSKDIPVPVAVTECEFENKLGYCHDKHDEANHPEDENSSEDIEVVVTGQAEPSRRSSFSSKAKPSGFSIADMDTCENDNDANCSDDGGTSSEDIKVEVDNTSDLSNAENLHRRCDICYEDIPFRNLEEHLQTHPQFEKLYKCDICPDSAGKMVYGSYKGLVWHYLQSSHRATQLPCKLCPEQDQGILFRRRDLCRHLYDFHQLDHPKLKCDFGNCSQEFCDPSSRSSHRVYSHFPKHRGKSLTCQLCKITFKTLHGLKQHRKRHKNDDANAKIPNCSEGETTSDNVGVPSPIDSSTGPWKTPYGKGMCDICYAKVPRRNLEQHLLKHSQFERQYKCDICPDSDFKRFYGSYKGLVWHYLQAPHHFKMPCHLCQDQTILFKERELCKHLYDFHQINHRKLQCKFEDCSEEFCDPTSRICHYRYKHSSKNGNLSCHLCQTKFKLWRNYKIHMTRHKRNKLFPCESCEKVYKYESSLREHRKCHEDSKDVPIAATEYEIKNKLGCHDDGHEDANYSEDEKVVTSQNQVKPSRRSPFYIKAKPSGSSNAENLRRKCDICYEDIPFKNLEQHVQTHPQFEKLYKCEICPESGGKRGYGSYKGLVWHYLNSTHNTQLPCKLCPDQDQTILFRGRDLCKHLYEFHKLDHPKLKCNFENCPDEFCDPVSRNRHRIYRHFPKHRGKSLECEICQATFRTFHGLRQHNKIHDKKVVDFTEFICDVCQKVCKGENFFQNHKKTHEEGYIPDLVECPQCSKKLRPKGLNKHIKSVHGTTDLSVDDGEYGAGEGPRNFVCDLCKTHFKSKLNLDRHIYWVHKKGKRQLLICDSCPKEFKTRDGLMSHKKVYHEESEVVVCPHCPKQYPRHLLDKHVKRTHGEKKFQCGFCPKTFSKRQQLQLHEDIHRNERNYKCTKCSYSGNTPSALRDHHLHNHMERKMKCEVCPLTFPDMRTLKRHERRGHREERAFKCEDCPKAFLHQGSLQNHKKVKHGVQTATRLLNPVLKVKEKGGEAK